MGSLNANLDAGNFDTNFHRQSGSATGAAEEAVCGGRPVRVGFLFNHNHRHQIPHGAPIVAALCRKEHPRLEIHVYVTGSDRANFLRRLLPQPITDRIFWHEIKAPLSARILERLVGRALPLERLGTLVRYRKCLAAMDALVVPETTSLFLKNGLGCRDLRLIYTQHGAGDRAVGFKPSIRHFDHVLVPGPKIKKRMLAEGIVRHGEFSEIGYPKFDSFKMDGPVRLFPNDNPVVLYNPHCHPAFSSWYPDGLKVLEFFRLRRDWNLVVAPHVMLFAKRLHISADPLCLRWRRGIPRRYFSAPNILLDMGSSACVDMTYTHAADIYLGDVSSQIYEFLHKPRPAIFLNSHRVDWREDANYAHWHLGAVIEDVFSLSPLLASQAWYVKQFATRQAEAFKETFGASPQGGGRRAAEAIARFVFASQGTGIPQNAQ